jgi:Holliday junction resolvasome RuvABC ATP-dependent DNA helicase subunit
MIENTTCLHPEIEEKIKEWIQKRDNYSAVLLLGNPGVGKTTIAHIIFKECKYSIQLKICLQIY